MIIYPEIIKIGRQAFEIPSFFKFTVIHYWGTVANEIFRNTITE